MNTHMGTLNAVIIALAFPQYKINRSIEFGCGEFSTHLFHDRSRDHTAIDVLGTSNRDINLSWVDKIEKQYSNSNCFVYSNEHYDVIRNFKGEAIYDLVFVDAQWLRPELVNEAFRHSETVVAHDTENVDHGYLDVQRPDGWHQISRANLGDQDPFGAWTTVWTKVDRVYNVLKLLGCIECAIPRGQA